jgi:lysophospholipase L1-like esterase
MTGAQTFQWPATDRPLRFLALGDSYTVGEGVGAADTWPGILVYRLRNEGRSAEDPVVIARTGWTTGELLEGIAAAHLERDFDLVSLLAGVNNQYRGQSAETYRVEFRSLLNLAIRFAAGRAGNTLVLSIPDWGATPFADGKDRVAIGREIDVFNSVNREEAGRTGAHYVDVTPSSRRAIEDPVLITGDGLHPSGKMYSAWVDLIMKELFSGKGSWTI